MYSASNNNGNDSNLPAATKGWCIKAPVSLKILRASVLRGHTISASEKESAREREREHHVGESIGLGKQVAHANFWPMRIQAASRRPDPHATNDRPTPRAVNDKCHDPTSHIFYIYKPENMSRLLNLIGSFQVILLKNSRFSMVHLLFSVFVEGTYILCWHLHWFLFF